MAKRFLYVGGKVAFMPRAALDNSDVTASEHRETAYSDTSIRVVSYSASADIVFTDNEGQADHAVAGETFWFKYQMSTTGRYLGTAGALLYFYNRAGEAVFRLYVPAVVNPSSLVWQVKQGASWVDVADTSSVPLAYEAVVRVQIGADGNHRFSFYVNGEQYGRTVAFSSDLVTGFSRVRINGVSNSGNTSLYYSQIIAAVGINLIGSKVKTLKPIASGSVNTMTSGTYADVDDTTINDGDIVTSTVPGQRIMFKFDQMPATPVGLVPGNTLRLYARSKTEGSEVTTLRFLKGQNGTITAGTDVPLDAGFEGYVRGYTLTPAEINDPSFELGFETAP